MDFKHQVFTIVEAAEHLKVSRSFIYKLIAEKRLKVTKLGTRSIIRGAEIERFLDRADAA